MVVMGGKYCTRHLQSAEIVEFYFYSADLVLIFQNFKYEEINKLHNQIFFSILLKNE
jgi:hypothetical protein